MELKNKKIKTIVIDDEKAAVEGMVLLLSKDPDFEVIETCLDGRDAIQKIENLQPDLLFLDIQMPIVNGFEVLQSISNTKIPVTVFVTAYDKYAIKAFDVNAIDYLLKPFDDKRFYDTLKKVKKHFNQLMSFEFQQKMLELLVEINDPESLNSVFTKDEYLKRIYIKDFKGITFLDVNSIKWILADDYYVTIHTSDKKYLLRETMNNLELKLDPSKFIRISRSCIININSVKLIEHMTKKDYILVTLCGNSFKMSVSRYKQIKNKFGI